MSLEASLGATSHLLTDQYLSGQQRYVNTVNTFLKNPEETDFPGINLDDLTCLGDISSNPVPSVSPGDPLEGNYQRLIGLQSSARGILRDIVLVNGENIPFAKTAVAQLARPIAPKSASLPSELDSHGGHLEVVTLLSDIMDAYIGKALGSEARNVLSLYLMTHQDQLQTPGSPGSVAQARIAEMKKKQNEAFLKR